MASLIAVFLFIEFLDELVFGTREAAWPLMRSDLGLSYAQIGMLLAVPEVVSGLLEPVIGIFGDTRHRQTVMAAGGVAFICGLTLAAVSQSVWPLLIAFMMLYPASGAFVSLSQATLMDARPGEHEQAMAQWTFAGSIGVVLGPVVLAAAPTIGLGWREVFVAWAGLALATVAWLRLRGGRMPQFPTVSEANDSDQAATSFRESLSGAFSAARRRSTWRWLVLLALSNLLMDVLLGFVALYLVDSTGVGDSRAGLAVSVMAISGLIGDGLIIPLLRRIPGLTWVRATAMIALPVFVLFLIVPGFWPKVSALVLIGLLNSGWYAVLKGQLYASLPGQSGTVMSISAVFDLATALVPLTLGLVAGQWGIGAAMALLAIGPVGLAIGVPRDATMGRCERSRATE
ncbi:MFS transporter [bacterium]|nr:MFS transporter [bacterium]